MTVDDFVVAMSLVEVILLCLSFLLTPVWQWAGRYSPWIVLPPVFVIFLTPPILQLIAIKTGWVPVP